MKQFIQQYGSEISSILSGWDRLTMRGSLRRISYPIGMTDFLFKTETPMKAFGQYANSVSKSLVEASCKTAVSRNRPVQYVGLAKTSKDEMAREVAEKDGITDGLIMIIKSVELCRTYRLQSDRKKHHLELVRQIRQCTVIYHYLIHPEFGFMNARIQSWFPFPIQICINGREWLSRILDKEGMAYQRYENCFPWIADFKRAQTLMHRQLNTNWPAKFDRIARMLNPIHGKIFAKYPLPYYWSAFQSEWATDIVFKDPDFLPRLYPRLLIHGIVNSASPDAMRFLGKKPRTNFKHEVVSKFKLGPEGARIKHQVAKNGVKLYGKYYNLLRAENTINNPSQMKAYRPSQKNPTGPSAWRQLRRGIADMARRAEISQAINDRYLDHFAALDTSTALAELLTPLTEPTTWNGYRVRGLRPSSKEDLSLFKAIMHGEFTITGFRNRDIQTLLFKVQATSIKEYRRRSSKISRLLRMLRAHHLIRRIPSTYRYLVSEKGLVLLKAVLSLEQITLDQLNKLAA